MSTGDKTGPQEQRELRERARRRLAEVRREGGDEGSLVEELEVHRAELEIQNEELQQARNELAVARDRYRDLFEHAPVGYLVLGPKGYIREANLRAVEMFGTSRAGLEGAEVAPFLADEAQDAWFRFRRSLVSDMERGTVELTLRAAGEERWRTVHLEAAPEPETDAAEPAYRCALSDITQRRRAEEEMRLASEVVANTQEGVMVTDAEGRILWVNPAFEHISGYTAAEAVGETPALLRSGYHHADFYAGMWQQLNEQGRWQGEIWNRRKDGDIYPEWLNISTVRDHQGRVHRYVGVFSDVSAQHQLQERLRHLAYYDAVTGLPNRQLLQDRMEVALSRASREGKRLAVVFLDLDGFKEVNDTLGHSVGDRLLRQAGGRIRSCLRDADTVGRQGGDEFTVLLPAIDEADDAATAAGRILEALAQPHRLAGHELVVRGSMGIAVLPEDGTTVEQLSRNADNAMYAAKAQGGGEYRFYAEEMGDRSRRRFSLVTALRKAVEEGDLTVVYQPQLTANGRGLTGVEALARWHHADEGWIPPGTFIPLAEENGLIEPLGRQILEEACRQMRQWRAAGLEVGRMAVNLSGEQLHDANLPEWVGQLLERNDLSARDLELELTEGVLMRNVELSRSLMQSLGAMGVSIAVDDFGTGYSSLSYLKSFPVDRLKIDRSFVQDVLSDADDAAIARTVIAMGHALGLRVIAEGVETEGQRTLLAEDGCDEVQGFLFSAPLGAEELAGWVRRGGLSGSGRG